MLKLFNAEWYSQTEKNKKIILYLGNQDLWKTASVKSVTCKESKWLNSSNHLLSYKNSALPQVYYWIPVP